MSKIEARGCVCGCCGEHITKHSEPAYTVHTAKPNSFSLTHTLSLAGSSTVSGSLPVLSHVSSVFLVGLLCHSMQLAQAVCQMVLHGPGARSSLQHHHCAFRLVVLVLFRRLFYMLLQVGGRSPRASCGHRVRVVVLRIFDCRVGACQCQNFAKFWSRGGEVTAGFAHPHRSPPPPCVA